MTGLAELDLDVLLPFRDADASWRIEHLVGDIGAFAPAAAPADPERAGR